MKERLQSGSSTILATGWAIRSETVGYAENADAT